MTITIQHPQGHKTGFKRILFVGAAGVAALLAVVAGQSVIDDTHDANPATSVASSSAAPAFAGAADSLGPITRPEPATAPVDSGSTDGVYQSRGNFSTDVEWLTANGWLTAPGATNTAISAERAHFLTINDVGTATPSTAAPDAVDYQPRGNFSSDVEWLRANGWLTSGS